MNNCFYIYIRRARVALAILALAVAVLACGLAGARQQDQQQAPPPDESQQAPAQQEPQPPAQSQQPAPDQSPAPDQPPASDQPPAPEQAPAPDQQPPATQGDQAPAPDQSPAAQGEQPPAPAPAPAPKAARAQRSQRRVAKPTSAAPAPAPAAAADETPSYVSAVRQNHLGMALMDQHQFTQALGKFQTACVMNPESDTGCVNMGIALLNMQQYDDARRVLAKSAERDPQSARAWFNLGLVEKAAGNMNDAAADFQKVAEIDPGDADTQYFLGWIALQAGQFDKAAAAFKRAIEIDPFYASAEDGLSQVAQHAGDTEGAKTHADRFQHITSERLGKAIQSIYGEQGKYSLAQDMEAVPQHAPAAIPVHFVNVTSLSGLPSRFSVAVKPRAAVKPDAPNQTAASALAKFLGSGACVFDYDGDGKPDIFLVNADGKGDAGLYRNLGGGKFEDVTKAAKIEFHGGGMGCAVGDYDSDGHPDLAVTVGSGVELFHNEGNGTFKDVTDAAGLRAGDSLSNEMVGLAMGVTFVDYDHDGDLDLYVTRFNDFPIDDSSRPFFFPQDVTPPGNTLWRNAGDGTFVNWTKQMALGGNAASVTAIGTDLRSDGNSERVFNRAVDFAVTGWEKFPSIFLSAPDRPFSAVNPWAISMAGPAAGVVALDFDHDGQMDLAFTHWAFPGVSIWRNVGGKSFERLPLVGPKWMRGWGIAAVDYDNDGWVDLVAVGETFAGEGRIVLLRNQGVDRTGKPLGFRDVTHETGLDKIVLHNPRSVVAFDAEGDGSTDFLVTQNNLPPVLLKNIGGNKNNWLKFALTGDPDNNVAIGTRTEVFSGALRQTWEVSGASGYLSQGPPEIHAGLGDEGGADVVRILWPTGVLQNQIQIAGGNQAPIAEAEPVQDEPDKDKPAESAPDKDQPGSNQPGDGQPPGNV